MTKKKVILIVISVLLILTIASVFAPVCVDKFFWGDNFEEQLITNNIEEMGHIIAKSNIGYYKEASKNYKNGVSFHSYYYKSTGFSKLYITDKDYNEVEVEKHIKNSISYKGRKVYMSVFFEYNNKLNEIKFEGTRWFFGKYSWKMLDNEFFPIKDEGFVNMPNEFADR